MRLLHPFMPFITEEIWQTLPHSGPSIMIRPYPTTPIREWDSKSDAEDFEVLEQFVTVARAGRSLLHYPPGKPLTLFGHAQDRQHLTTLNKLHPHLEHLSKGTIELSPSESWSAHKVLKLPGEFLVVGIVVESDIDLKKVRDRIVKQSEEGKTDLARVNGKLFNTEFLNKAPLEVVSELRNRHEQLEHQMQLLSSTYDQIESMIQSRST